MNVPSELISMLDGEHGATKQKAARLVIDLASSAGASDFVRCEHSHVSGVSVITGGHGLRRFLSDLAGDEKGTVSIPTTLNSAGCDREKFEEMEIDYPDFLKYQFEIIDAYDNLGIDATLSCTPYDRGIELAEGVGSWAESNAVCFSNSYTSLITNRESGLSALATALTGWAPLWGLHIEENRFPNIRVVVESSMENISDWSVLGDWIGKQIRPEWKMPWGMMPHITGLPSDASFEMRKALTAAAANYGCPMLWVDGHTKPPEITDKYEGELLFTEKDLQLRYQELRPSGAVDLVVIGCPQASVGEVRTTASYVRSKMENGEIIPDKRLWIFTSGHNYNILESDGTIDLLEEAGALVLKDTCPEVTPYNRNKYNHILTNSLKAEHYLTSGLNKMPTSVSTISDCVHHAFYPNSIKSPRPTLESINVKPMFSNKTYKTGTLEINGKSLPSQNEWSIKGTALVTDVPITYLGYVNRDTGVIEERGHPLNGVPIQDTILIYPKGSGSTVAPFVLMGLIYTGKGPKAIINCDVCPLTLPAASLLNVPYAHGFELNPTLEVNTGDQVSVSLNDGVVRLSVISRVSED